VKPTDKPKGTQSGGRGPEVLPLPESLLAICMFIFFCDHPQPRPNKPFAYRDNISIVNTQRNIYIYIYLEREG
jgi:hypothetical protein